MRIWIGKEVEGKHIGKLTLFVETTMLAEENLKTVKLYAEMNKVEAIYFGAGRKDVTYLQQNQLLNLLDYCYNHDIIVTIETTNLDIWVSTKELSDALHTPNTQIVLRTMTSTEFPTMLLTNLVCKIDDNKFCYFSPFKCNSITNLATLNESLYEGVDKLIYDNMEG